MIDMNVIMLEGIGLYIVLAIVLFMIIAICALSYAGINDDRKIEELQAQLMDEREKNIELNHANFYLKLKYGALDIETDYHDKR